jgi:hypothetical protein
MKGLTPTLLALWHSRDKCVSYSTDTKTVPFLRESYFFAMRKLEKTRSIYEPVNSRLEPFR